MKPVWFFASEETLRAVSTKSLPSDGLMMYLIVHKVEDSRVCIPPYARVRALHSHQVAARMGAVKQTAVQQCEAHLRFDYTWKAFVIREASNVANEGTAKLCIYGRGLLASHQAMTTIDMKQDQKMCGALGQHVKRELVARVVAVGVVAMRNVIAG